MTRIQFVIVLALVVIITVVAVPRAIMVSRLTKAENRALTIASAFQQYRVDTGQECSTIDNLLNDSGVSGWLGPYISAKVVLNPWGGTYTIDSQKKKIGIPVGDKAPDQYEFGGADEISFSFGSSEYDTPIDAKATNIQSEKGDSAEIIKSQ
jgi:type II secretory pathway pseudopilin PulG